MEVEALWKSQENPFLISSIAIQEEIKHHAERVVFAG